MHRRYFMQDDTFVSQLTVDAEPIIQKAKDIAETQTSGNAKFVGSVPLSLYQDFLIEAQQKGIWAPGQPMEDFDKWMIARLKSGEYNKLRGH